MVREKLLDYKLRNGWVTLEREATSSGATLHFNVELNTRFPADTIFQQLVLGMTDSHRSWMWPVAYESSPDPAPDVIHEGMQFRMTYRVPRFDDPRIAAKPVTYTYSLPQYRPVERLLEYRSVDHPLEGGAVVRVIPLGPTTSRLSWMGSYLQKTSSDLVVRSMISYIPFLYGVFEDNIEAREQSTRARNGNP